MLFLISNTYQGTEFANVLHFSSSWHSKFCPFNSNIHTIWHLFIECTQASSFWVDFQEWFNSHSEKKLQLSNLDVLYGTFHSSSHCLVLNYLIIIGKCFLYTNAGAKNKFLFDDFIFLVQDKMFFLSLRAGGVLQILHSDWFRERECLLSVNEQKA